MIEDPGEDPRMQPESIRYALEETETGQQILALAREMKQESDRNYGVDLSGHRRVKVDYDDLKRLLDLILD